ncbi:uncharacterized protein DEA37_0000123 [Paragonimus westermani]|uniref:Uncharacterized protein n=1 Tax=Paragonimus westermani TaxID=34504 RepID=A0A5J4NWV2_9TREM|nr:uncharacterized protein DEA37_0000123 [Paragonimus westermani]
MALSNRLHGLMTSSSRTQESNRITHCSRCQRSDKYVSKLVRRPTLSLIVRNQTEEVNGYGDLDHLDGLVSFSILFGLILGQMGDKAIVMVQFFAILNEVIMRMVQVIML